MSVLQCMPWPKVLMKNYSGSVISCAVLVALVVIIVLTAAAHQHQIFGTAGPPLDIMTFDSLQVILCARETLLFWHGRSHLAAVAATTTTAVVVIPLFQRGQGQPVSPHRLRLPWGSSAIRRKFTASAACGCNDSGTRSSKECNYPCSHDYISILCG